MARLAELSFTKGHGTANDFILVQDTDNTWQPTKEQVSWLCDRRRGIGADGVIRVVPTVLVPDAAELAEAVWFMDYRNSDGSIAEMCGNGARVFARYLVAAGFETDKSFLIATRAGLHEIVIQTDLSVSVSMGSAVATPENESISVSLPGVPRVLPARGVHVPNPHAVVFIPAELSLGELDLTDPSVKANDLFPEGVNIEFVVRKGDKHLQLRVVERGSGETMSCGTGACAVAWVDMQDSISSDGEWQIDVPGGTLWVSQIAGHLWLRGPAELVARGKVLLPANLL